MEKNLVFPLLIDVFRGCITQYAQNIDCVISLNFTLFIASIL